MPSKGKILVVDDNPDAVEVLKRTLMDEDYEPFEIHEADREDIEEFANSSSKSRSKRGAMSVARFKIIGRLAWTREDGLEPDVWDNSLDAGPR